MKKIILPLVAIIILGGIVGILALDSVVKNSIETHGSRLAGSAVRVGSVNVLLFMGKAHFKDVEIENPEGFSSDNAFVLSDIDVVIDVASVFSDVLIIKELKINAPEITYELSFKGGNMAALKRNIAKHSNASGTTAEHAKESTESKVKKKVIIEQLYITGARVNYGESLSGNDTMETVSLPDIHAENIGVKKGGVSMAEASAIVLQHVTQGLTQLDAGDIKRQIKGLGDKIKGLFN